MSKSFFAGFMSSASRTVRRRGANPNHPEIEWLKELKEVRPNKDGRDPFIDPNFINPETSRFDPADPAKGRCG